MGLLRRNEDDRRADDDRVTREEDEEREERAGPSPGLVRALITLAGVAAAGFLIWLAQTFDWDGSTSGFWIAAALLAAAGLVLGLSQLFGGWTKWGWPTLSPSVFLFAFLPTLIVGGWILLARQPQDGVQEGRVDQWSDDIGIGGLVDALFELWPAIPLVIGLVLAFSFDTTGPRTRIVRGERVVRDEDVHDYRRERDDTRDVEHRREPATVASTTTTRRVDTDAADERRSETSVSEDVRHRDADTTAARSSESSVAEDLRRRDEPGDASDRRTT